MEHYKIIRIEQKAIICPDCEHEQTLSFAPDSDYTDEVTAYDYEVAYERCSSPIRVNESIEEDSDTITLREKRELDRWLVRL